MKSIDGYMFWVGVDCEVLPFANNIDQILIFYHGFLSNQFINGWSFFDATAIADSVM